MSKKESGLKDVRIIFSTRDLGSRGKDFIEFVNKKLNYECTDSILIHNRYLEIVKKANQRSIYIIGHHYCPKSVNFVSGSSIFNWLEIIRLNMQNTKM